MYFYLIIMVQDTHVVSLPSKAPRTFLYKLVYACIYKKFHSLSPFKFICTFLTTKTRFVEVRDKNVICSNTRQSDLKGKFPHFNVIMTLNSIIIIHINDHLYPDNSSQGALRFCVITLYIFNSTLAKPRKKNRGFNVFWIGGNYANSLWRFSRLICLPKKNNILFHLEICFGKVNISRINKNWPSTKAKCVFIYNSCPIRRKRKRWTFAKNGSFKKYTLLCFKPLWVVNIRGFSPEIESDKVHTAYARTLLIVWVLLRALHKIDNSLQNL